MTTQSLLQDVLKARKEAQAKKPLAPSITNIVTVNFVANAQLAVGGAAAMFHMGDEGEFLAGFSNAFYVNLGTMMEVFEHSVPRLCKAANANKVPWVLDPVAIGIGELRTKILKEIKQCKPSVIRANASETIALCKLWGLADDTDFSGPKGVENADEIMSALSAAKSLAKFTGGAVAVSGELDLISDGTNVILCHGGSELLTKITGAGCSLGGVAAVYAAVANPLIAGLSASIIYNEAAIKASQKASAPASFQVAFLDALYSLEDEEILKSNIEIIS